MNNAFWAYQSSQVRSVVTAPQKLNEGKEKIKETKVSSLYTL